MLRCIGEVCEDLGFFHEKGNLFCRSRGAIQDAFYFQQTRSNNQYIITYGVNCPGLAADLRSDSEGIAITPWPPVGLENGRSYGCKYAEHIPSSTKKVRSALESEAVPWFEHFHTEADFVDEYKVRNVPMDEPPAEMNGGQRIRVTIYGMLLYDSGRKDEALPWLNAALKAFKVDANVGDDYKDWPAMIESRIA